MNPGTKGGGGVTLVGDDCLFMTGAHVGHDARLGDRIVIANQSAIAGHCQIDDDAIIGGLSGVHQFVRIGKGADDAFVRIGISEFAVDQLGDIVFVDLPDEGTAIAKGESFGSVESVKAVEEMYSPISGEVVKRNESVLDSPDELQNDPHGEGWLLVVRPSDLTQFPNKCTSSGSS